MPSFNYCYDKILNMNNHCFAKYILAYPQNQKESVTLAGPNSIVGNNFDLRFDIHKKTCSIINKFNQKVAQVNSKNYDELVLLYNKQFCFRCILTYVAYKDVNGGKRFGEFLIISFNNKDKQNFSNFCSIIQNKIAHASRPEISLDDFEYKKICETNGSWQPKKFLKWTKLDKNTAIIKNKISFIERLIEAARNKNPGCYFFTILFLLIIIAIIVFIVFIFK